MSGEVLQSDVADAFVKQYYAVLTRCPENLHKFYQESSLLGWPGHDDVATPVTTLPGIKDKIMSSDYKNCSVEITTFDSQESQDGGVIVAVIGTSTGKDDVRKNFSQTFFLAKQEKGFFVLNDILRFLDVSKGQELAEVGPEDSVNVQPAPSVQNSVSHDISERPTSSHSKEVVENPNNKDAIDLSASNDTVAKDASSTSSAASLQTPSSVVAPASNVKVEPKKATYAAMVAKDAPAPNPTTARIVSDVSNQSVASPIFKSSTDLGNGASKVSNPSNAVSKAPAPPSKVVPARNVSPNREARRIYIGRLPYDITKQGLGDIMERFGPVRRNPDTIQIRRHEDGFVCGFLEFESADSARRAVEAHHVKFGEKEAYVTYKRSTPKRGNDTRGGYPSRAGSRRDNSKGRESSGEVTNTGKVPEGKPGWLR